MPRNALSSIPRPFTGRLLDESARLRTLEHYSVLDTPPEAAFDRLTTLAAQVFEVPIATIAFIDESRQWFKSRFGIELAQTPRSVAFCDHTIRDRQVMVVLDTTKDARFFDNPLVRSDPSVRFYAGAPIVTAEGGAIGSFAIHDRLPRPAFGRRERAILQGLADMALHELDLRMLASDVHRDTCAALQRGGELFRLALGGSPIGVFTKTRDLVYDWAFNRVCGRPAEAIVGRRAAEVFPPEDAAFLEGLAKGVIAGGEPLHVQIRCTAPDSMEPLQIDYRLEALRDPEGAIEGVVGIAIDVTEDTRLQRDAAAARAKAEAAGRAKNRFLAAASHDLRQPFQAMRLFADVLDQRLSDPRNRAILEQLNHAMLAGENLLGALLEISVLEAETVKPMTAPFSIRMVTRQIADEMAPLAAEKGLRLRHIVPDVDVVSDPMLLQRLLRHLVANAIRFSNDGKVLIGGRRHGDDLEVHVCDAGIGIPAYELTRVFEPFYQLGNPERDRIKGLGLGLAISDKTAQLLGHRLSVRSRPGHGSVFTISIALAPDQTIHSKSRPA